MTSETPRIAYYQMSTDAGYVKLEMPFLLSPEDAEDVARNLELVIRQIRRRADRYRPTEANVSE